MPARSGLARFYEISNKPSWPLADLRHVGWVQPTATHPATCYACHVPRGLRSPYQSASPALLDNPGFRHSHSGPVPLWAGCQLQNTGLVLFTGCSSADTLSVRHRTLFTRVRPTELAVAQRRADSCHLHFQERSVARQPFGHTRPSPLHHAYPSRKYPWLSPRSTSPRFCRATAQSNVPVTPFQPEKRRPMPVPASEKSGSCDASGCWMLT